MPDFEIRDDFLIPLEEGHAAARGWPATTEHRPVAVTWHWTATADLAECDRLLGGREPLRKGKASAHYAIGRSFAEGIHRYVALDNRSFHAGKNQTLRWDGQPYRGPGDKGSRTAIGIETVNLGYARRGHPADDDWLPAVDPAGTWYLRIQPWTEEQIHMIIAIGRQILGRWSHIPPRAHHGHHDICPGHKVDVVAFPFARVLRDIYRDPDIPDVWTSFWPVRPRQQALIALGQDLGPSGADGRWGPKSDGALRRFQHAQGLVDNGRWSTFVGWKIYDLFREQGLDFGSL